jgi:hypothetical protein
MGAARATHSCLGGGGPHTSGSDGDVYADGAFSPLKLFNSFLMSLRKVYSSDTFDKPCD